MPGLWEYLPFLAEFYDAIPIYAARADVDFYVQLARNAQGAVLELGCGTGRILIPTAVAGAPIVGLDLSEHMLARCREKLARQPAEVQRRARIVHGSMTRFDLGESFRLVTTPFRSFQHLVRVEDQLACLGCAHRHLEPGGRLVLDMFQVIPQATYDPAWMQEKEDVPQTALPDGRRFRRTARVVAFHPAEQYNDVEFIYYVAHPDGRTQRLSQTFPFRYFYPYEVEHLLARSGFRLLHLFGNYDRSPFAADSPEMLFLAEKR